MYTAICAEPGATKAIASSALYIQFNLNLYLLVESLGDMLFSSLGRRIILY